MNMAIIAEHIKRTVGADTQKPFLAQNREAQQELLAAQNVQEVLGEQLVQVGRAQSINKGPEIAKEQNKDTTEIEM